jgi:hypothetical protein
VTPLRAAALVVLRAAVRDLEAADEDRVAALAAGPRVEVALELLRDLVGGYRLPASHR